MTTAIAPDLRADIAALRAFNRFYTRRIGLLDEHLDQSPFTLPEARVLYELADRPRATAADLSRELGMDPAQLSRLLKRLSGDGLVDAEVGAHAKHRLLTLTDAGRAAYGSLAAAANQAAGGLLGRLADVDRARLMAGTRAVMDVLADPPPLRVATLRAPRAGELGLVVQRQAELYAREYGWDWTYEALVAQIVADFVRQFDPARDQAWVAALDDDRVVGSVFLVHTDNPAVGKLRLLYVDGSTRGLGLGRRLVEACIARAREIGYERLDLWTNSVLHAARGLYQSLGFTLADEAPHRAFGHDLVGQTWSLPLRAG